MKKIIFSILLLLMITPIVFAQTQEVEAVTPAVITNEDGNIPNIDENSELKEKLLNKNENIFIRNHLEESEEVPAEETIELRGYVGFDDTPDETIYLDYQGETEQNTIYIKEIGKKNSVRLNKPKNIESKSLVEGYQIKQSAQRANRLEAASRFSAQEYSVKGLSGSYSAKSGNLSFGTTYNSGLSSAQMNYSTGVFTKYDGKHYAITTAYTRKTNSGFDTFSDRMYIAPELKITKRLSLLDVMETDPLQVRRRNEVVLRYNPKIGNNEDINFEIGASQSFFENQYINSAIRFSTSFKL